MAENQEDFKVKLTRVKGTEIAKIIFQNPPFNLLSGEILMLIGSCLEKVRGDERARAVIIEGKGLFSAGADASEIFAIAQEGKIEKALELLSRANAVVDAIQNLGKPTVAVINGLCWGGGNELAMACTVRIAAEDAKFGQPEIKLGIMPGMGGTQRLPRLVDLETALRLVLSGTDISAQDALDSGLVDDVVTASELDLKAVSWANRLIAEPLERKPAVFDVKKFDELIASDLFKEWTEKKSVQAVNAIVTGVKSGMCLPLEQALKLEQKLFAELVVQDSAKAGLAKLVGKGRASRGGRFVLPSDKLPETFTVNDLSDEQKLIRDSIEDFVAENIATEDAVKRIESKDLNFSRKLIKDLADLGVLGIEVPEEYGGVDLGTVVSAIAAEAVSAQGSFACTLLAHTGIGTLPIRFFGTEAQKKKYLPKLVSGEWVASYLLTENTAGSDANSIKTVARLSEDGKNYILSGEKIYGTNGGFADLFTVFAKIDGKDLSAFIVERESEGLRIGREEHKMGIQGSSTAVILLDSVKVPVENLLGERGKGFKIAVNILNLGRFKLGAACLGAGRACLAESLEYSKSRKQFGQPLYNFGAIRLKLARMAAANYAMEAVVYRTAGLLEEAIKKVDAGDSVAVLRAIEEFAIECSAIKVSCSEALDFIVDENVQIHGGSGFCEGNPERRYRDSRINRLFEGTNEINRLLLSGMVIKKTALGSLPIMDEANRIRSGAVACSIPGDTEDEVTNLLSRLNDAKKSVVLLIASAFEKFGAGIDRHQTVLMLLADCLINIYVMDSVLAAFAKNKKDANLHMTRLIFHDGLTEIERLAGDLHEIYSGSQGNMENLTDSILEGLN